MNHCSEKGGLRAVTNGSDNLRHVDQKAGVAVNTPHINKKRHLHEIP